MRELKRLNSSQATLFELRLLEFVADLLEMEQGRRTWFRKNLRVKKVRGQSNVYEMSWAADGRATFALGTSPVDGKLHIVWLRIGSHDILP
ncbi:MAG: hypothetical protein OXE93_05015 [bacterium]|nr:hypothetical protein [bacterium]